MFEKLGDAPRHEPPPSNGVGGGGGWWKRWMIVVGVIIAIGFVRELVVEDDIDRFLDDRSNVAARAEFFDEFLPSCISEGDATALDMGVRISRTAMRSYCSCAGDIVLQRANEADLRASVKEEITDHMNLIVNEAIDTCGTRHLTADAVIN